jgi:putative RecB family exonuclease
MLSLQELRKKPHWSFSSLNSFINGCSLAWAFRYIYKETPEHSPANLLFGKAFHDSAEFIAAHRMEGIKLWDNDIAGFFRNAWNAHCRYAEKVHYKDGDSHESLGALGVRMLECLNSSWPETSVAAIAEPFSVELRDGSGRRISEKPLIGELDCIIRKEDGAPLVIDWKTSARKWPADKEVKDLQATCFCYAFRRMNGRIPDFRFDIVTKAKTPVYEQRSARRNGDDFDRLCKMVEQVEKAVAAEAFLPAEQSFYCSDCVYKTACENWHRNNARTVSVAA